MSTEVLPLLVLGWGNRSRGDDALGPLCVEALREALPTHLQGQVEFLEDYQLQIEFALDLVGREHVLFIDASMNCAAPFEVRTVRPQRDSSISSHALSPDALLQVFVDLRGHAPPPSNMLAIRAAKFGLGEPMSAGACEHMQAALAWALAWLEDPSLH